MEAEGGEEGLGGLGSAALALGLDELEQPHGVARQLALRHLVVRHVDEGVDGGGAVLVGGGLRVPAGTRLRRLGKRVLVRQALLAPAVEGVGAGGRDGDRAALAPRRRAAGAAGVEDCRTRVVVIARQRGGGRKRKGGGSLLPVPSVR